MIAEMLTVAEKEWKKLVNGAKQEKQSLENLDEYSLTWPLNTNISPPNSPNR